ncbi:TraR/DksA family transcriptional regulator [soil metagenome]
MSDQFDMASEREEHARAIALQEQNRRAGLTGKTVADSAAACNECGDTIPVKRREAMPGCQTCIACQAQREKAFYER